jgi:hypothetical protein
MPVQWGDVATWLTAIGTLAVAVAAVWIALWSEQRTDRRVAEERKHGEEQLRAERAHGDERLEKERQHVQDREQLSEAYAVQVAAARMEGEPIAHDAHGDVAESEQIPVVVVINHGRYTITRTEAQFCLNGNLATPHRREYLSSVNNLPPMLPPGQYRPLQGPEGGVLTPADIGLRFVGNVTVPLFMTGAYPLVRWTDQWGTRWEHRNGQVRKVADDEPWKP